MTKNISKLLPPQVVVAALLLSQPCSLIHRVMSRMPSFSLHVETQRLVHITHVVWRNTTSDIIDKSVAPGLCRAADIGASRRRPQTREKKPDDALGEYLLCEDFQPALMKKKTSVNTKCHIVNINVAPYTTT
jgi:hypothetical protein